MIDVSVSFSSNIIVAEFLQGKFPAPHQTCTRFLIYQTLTTYGMLGITDLILMARGESLYPPLYPSTHCLLPVYGFFELSKRVGVFLASVTLFRLVLLITAGINQIPKELFDAKCVRVSPSPWGTSFFMCVLPFNNWSKLIALASFGEIVFQCILLSLTISRRKLIGSGSSSWPMAARSHLVYIMTRDSTAVFLMLLGTFLSNGHTRSFDELA